jgi:hypothetical protein
MTHTHKARKCYAGYQPAGITTGYDKPNWSVCVFDNLKDCEKWLRSNQFKNGRTVAVKLTREQAYQLAGISYIPPAQFYGEHLANQS